MNQPNKASNMPANAASGADSSAPGVVTASTTGSGTGWPPPGWTPPWVQPQPFIPQQPNPFQPQYPQQPQLPTWQPDTITTDRIILSDGTGNIKETSPIEKLMVALGIVVFPFPTPPAKCSACEQEGPILLGYGTTIHRYICKVCALKVLDRLLGSKVDAELESILYDKERK